MSQINKDALDINDNTVLNFGDIAAAIESALTLFLNGDYEYVDDFTKEMHIKRFEFNQYLLYVSKQKKYETLTAKLNKKINELDNKKANDIKEILDEKYDLYQNGILTKNGTIREFDYIDFFEGNKFYPNDMLKEASKIYKGKKYIFYRKLLCEVHPTLPDINLKFKPYLKGEIEQLKNTVFVCNVKFDENNRPIPNTGITIGREEVTEIINFLEENNIPVMPVTFKAAKKRYIENTLEMNINNQKTRTRKGD